MSAFEGYLEMGGNELVNNSRTRGIAQSAQPCPMWWLKGPTCDTLGDALGEAGQYNWNAIASAPWFDPDLPQSRDFFGFFAHSITQVYDSTRTVPRTEGIGDGGMLGRTRKAMKEVRVKGLLMGRGRLAIEYGQAWLSAAVDPGACGQHGDECGLTDLAWFADCPPERAQVPDGVWVETARNLATNPSFEATTAATVEVRRNLLLNTMNGASTAYLSQTRLTASTAAGYLLCTINATPIGGANNRVGRVSDPTQLAVPGEVFSVRAEVGFPSKAASFDISVLFQDAANAQVGPPIVLPTVSWAAGEGFKELGLQNVVVPAGAHHIGYEVRLGTATGWVVGDTFQVRNALMEKSPVLGTFFDGSTLPAGDFTHAWTGTANASPSVQYGTASVGVSTNFSVGITSSEWAASGAKSLRIIPTSASNDTYANIAVAGLVVGKTYTAIAKARLTAPQAGTLASAARKLAIRFIDGATALDATAVAPPNAAGVYEVRVGFTVPTGTTAVYLRPYNGASVGNGEVWWDDLLIVEGEYDGPYFDGSTPSDDEMVRYRWTGTADGSASVEEAQHMRPLTDEEYAEVVRPYVRYLHDAACISGPLITGTLESGDFMAYEVEMVFAAERPWVYGVTRDVNLPPTTPVIVQDIPYNLAPYPSAELSEGTVIVAENLSTNPSLETNDVGWLGTQSVIPVGNIVSGRVTGELAAVGVASYRRVFTAVSAGGPGYMSAYQQVDIAAAQGLRASISMWAAAVILAGTPTLGTLTFYATWRNGSTALRADNLGSVPVAGGAVNAKSIEVPATTTNVLVEARLNVTSWANGNVIRLYTDALAVTVP